MARYPTPRRQVIVLSHAVWDVTFAVGWSFLTENSKRKEKKQTIHLLRRKFTSREFMYYLHYKKRRFSGYRSTSRSRAIVLL